MDHRGRRPVDLARAAGLSTGTLINVLGGLRRPVLGFCTKVAEVLLFPSEQVVRQAGLLPPAAESTPSLSKTHHFFS